MSSGCETLSPRPAAFTGPISMISADNFLGLESDYENESRRSSRDDFVDLENGDTQEGLSADGVEISIGILEAGRYTTRPTIYVTLTV